MDSNPKYITANIQGMFNLQKLIFEAYEELDLDKFNHDAMVDR